MKPNYRRLILLKIIIKLILVLVTTTGFSQSRDVEAIKEVMRMEEETWNRGDIEGYVNLYAPEDSTRMILSKGIAAGKENILAFYKKYWPKEKMGQLKLTGDSFERISNKYYYVTGYFEVSYPDGKKVNGRYSGLMKKIRGRWYLYTDHAG